MRKLVKIVAIVLGIVIVLIVGAAVALPIFVDPNDYKAQIESQVESRTGRNLDIEGDIGLTVFPWLGIEMGKLTLGNAEGFPGEVFARTDRVSVRVKLMPLLSRRIEMDKVVIHGLTVNLARNAQGRGNWEDLAQPAQAPAGEAAPAPSGGGGIEALAIGGLDIREANLTWRDARSGQRFELRDLSLQTGALAPQRPVDLELEFRFQGEEPRLAGHVAMSGSLEVEDQQQVFLARDLQLDAELSADGLPQGEVALSLGGNVGTDLGRQTLTVDDLRLTALGLDASGQLAVSDLQTKPKISGSLRVAEFSPRALLEKLGRPAVETADPKALTRASMFATLGGTSGSVELQPLEIHLDDTTLGGNLMVTQAKVPAVRFDLALDAIDVDRYLPPKGEGGGEGGGQAAPAGEGASAAALPVEAARDLDVDGKLAIGKLKVANLNLSDIGMTLKAKDGVVRLSPMSATLYEGSFSGELALDARAQTPKLSAKESLSGVQIGPLLRDLQQSEERITGKGDVALDLSATGATPEAMKRSLDGNGRFTFNNGALKGVNIGRMIREAKARLQGGSLPPSEGPVQTDFTELSGTVKIENGVATNDDLSAKSPLLRIEGRGTADIPAETLDYRIRTTLVATAAGQGGKGLEDLAGIPIPIRVTGTFAQPSYGLDFEAFAQEVAKSKAGAIIEQQKEGAKEQVQEKAKGLLKGILGN